MIEIMPFLARICYLVEGQMKNESDHAILATIVVAFALSTVLTGLVFLVIGYFKMGSVLSFFPRHILIVDFTNDNFIGLHRRSGSISLSNRI